MAPGGGVSSREAVAKFTPAPGWCSHDVARELPGLRVVAVEVRVQRQRSLTAASPGDVISRLRELSNRMRGATAVSMRQQPIAAAYRVFFRQVGLDPDVVRTPMEAAVLERMLRGGFLSGGLLPDVLLIAMVDTGVPVWALDAESVSGALGIRASAPGERLGRAQAAPELAAGRLVVVDDCSPVAVLFGELAPGHEPASGSRRLVLFALQVEGVPDLYVEEALWSVTAALGAE
jgi:DNA/RNA-binding domain of Phe-tRNA-synthetase-like protein